MAALEGMKIRNDREILLHFTPFQKMMIIGRKDPVLNYEALIEQVEEAEVKVVEFPDGHMSFIENKSQFIDNIKKFLKLRCKKTRKQRVAGKQRKEASTLR